MTAPDSSPERPNRSWQRWLPLLVVLFHVIGALGFLLHVPSFERLTPLHVGVLSGCFLAAQRWSPSQLAALGGFALAGFGVEALGVHTGFPFGSYVYDHALGPEVFEVPPLIGLNWALLLGCCAALVEPLAAHFTLRAALGACAMVALDVFIEPVAMARGFWTWTGGVVPTHNYVAWGIISFLLLLPYCAVRDGTYGWSRRSPVAAWIYGSEVAFFALVGLT